MARVGPQAHRAGPAAVPVAIGLGSNLGDRRRHLRYAVDRLQAQLAGLRLSTVRETEPVGVPDAQPPFLNAVVVGETTLGALALLSELQAIERGAGRERPFARAARTLDLDLLFYGDLVIDTPALAVPHPCFRERRFVLEPLAELAPEWRDPVTGQTVGELWAAYRRG